MIITKKGTPFWADKTTTCGLCDTETTIEATDEPFGWDEYADLSTNYELMRQYIFGCPVCKQLSLFVMGPYPEQPVPYYETGDDSW